MKLIANLIKNTLLEYFCVLVLLFAFSMKLQAEEQFITTSDGVKLYVNVKGTGLHCLYIHGGPGSGSYWMEKFMGDYLEKHFQMVYLDQRGVGRSSSPLDGNYSMERMTRDFEEVREALGISSWLVMGHSFGGMLQMSYVLSHPGVINGLIFINCTLSLNDSFGKSWLPKAIALAGDATPSTSLDTANSVYDRMLAIMPVLGERDLMWKIFFADRSNSQKMNETYAHFESWNSDQSEKILEFADYWQNLTKATSSVKQPVLFFYGKADWAIGPEHFQNVHFPNMILWGSEVGHMPFLENRIDLEKAITAYLENYKSLITRE